MSCVFFCKSIEFVDNYKSFDLEAATYCFGALLTMVTFEASAVRASRADREHEDQSITCMQGAR